MLAVVAHTYFNKPNLHELMAHFVALVVMLQPVLMQSSIFCHLSISDFIQSCVLIESSLQKVISYIIYMLIMVVAITALCKKVDTNSARDRWHFNMPLALCPPPLSQPLVASTHQDPYCQVHQHSCPRTELTDHLISAGNQHPTTSTIPPMTTSICST
jgi:hypothetical protein